MNKYQKVVVTGCLIKDNKVLLIQRSMNEKFYPGKYEMPGGKVDFGEYPEESLKREYKEETKLNIEVKMPFYTFAYNSGNDTRHTVEIVYIVNLLDKEPKIILSPKDHIDYKRVKNKDLGKYFEDKNDPILIAIKKGFELS